MRKKDKRTFIIFMKHQRWKRLWQFFFTGWGLVMVAALVAASLFTKQLLWTPISAINMKDIASNQFKMSNAVFAGTDTSGEPFKLRAESGRQEYSHPDIIYIEKVSGVINRVSDGNKVTDNITARAGRYNRTKKTIVLLGDVRVDSSDGNKILTNELVIKL